MSSKVYSAKPNHTPGLNFSKSFQRIDFARLSYRKSSPEPWTEVVCPYKVDWYVSLVWAIGMLSFGGTSTAGTSVNPKAQASIHLLIYVFRRMKFQGNVCDIVIDGSGITICQQARYHNPHTQAVGKRSSPRQRCKIVCKTETNSEFYFTEGPWQSEATDNETLITIAFTCAETPQIQADSYTADADGQKPTDPVTALQTLNAAALTMPLAEFARSFIPGEGRHVQLCFKRKAPTVVKARGWLWPSVFYFLSGHAEYKTVSTLNSVDGFAQLKPDIQQTGRRSRLGVELASINESFPIQWNFEGREWLNQTAPVGPHYPAVQFGGLIS